MTGGDGGGILGSQVMMMMIWVLGRRNKTVIWRPCGTIDAARND